MSAAVDVPRSCQTVISPCKIILKFQGFWCLLVDTKLQPIYAKRGKQKPVKQQQSWQRESRVFLDHRALQP